LFRGIGTQNIMPIFFLTAAESRGTVILY